MFISNSKSCLKSKTYAGQSNIIVLSSNNKKPYRKSRNDGTAAESRLLHVETAQHNAAANNAAFCTFCHLNFFFLHEGKIYNDLILCIMCDYYEYTFKQYLAIKFLGRHNLAS